MKNKIILIFFIISVLAIPIFTQVYRGKGKMKGTITDEQGIPIPNVKVKLFNLKGQAGYEIKSNKDGIWKAFWIRGGNWHLDFLKEGFEIKRITSPYIKESSQKPYIVDVILKKIKGPVVSKNLLKVFEKGNDLYNAKKYNEALIIFNSIIKESPKAYIINLSIGNCYMQMKNYDKAIEIYKKVIEKDPENSDTIIAIGSCYNNKKDSKSAMEWYRKIDESKIKDPVVLYNIGVFNFNANKSERAVIFFNLAIKADDKYLDAYYQLGLSYLGLGNMKDAIKIFNIYIKLDKNSQRSSDVKNIIKELSGTL